MDIFDSAPSAPRWPLRIGVVTLIVHDLDAMTRFYERAIGLETLARLPDETTLGAGGEPIIVLRRDAGARRREPTGPGLFHTAFLLPRRDDLGRWLACAARTGVPLTGAADHLVSEAIYLDDPEGNGIEVYADRAPGEWTWRDGEVVMANERIDLAALARAPGYWNGAPAGTIVGHVHLQVSDLQTAQAFYGDVAGLDLTCRYPGALFLASGGYHHHVAVNIWNSRGAPAPARPCTGLRSFELLRQDAAFAAPLPAPGQVASEAPLVLTDPWGVDVFIHDAPSHAGAPLA